MIVSKDRILREYETVFKQHRNDAHRFAAVAKTLGICPSQVVETVHEAQTEKEEQ